MISADKLKLFQVAIPIGHSRVRGKTKVLEWLWEFGGLMLSASFWHKIILYEKKCPLMVDSGGFQYGGKQKRDKLKEFFSLREKLYRWQCLYADYIIGGDIPTSLTKDFEFIKKCLLLTMDNMDLQFKLGAEGRFVNVVHGHSPEAIRYWFKGVKGYPSIGWSLGSALKTSVYGFGLQLFTLYELGAFKNKLKIIHCLGGTSKDVVVGIHYLLSKLGVQIDVLSFDSSSSSAERFGNIISEEGAVISFSDIRNGRKTVKLWDGTVLAHVPLNLSGKFREDLSRTNMTNTAKVWNTKLLGMIRDQGDAYYKIVEASGAKWMWEVWQDCGVNLLYKEMVRQGVLDRVLNVEIEDECKLV